MRLYSIKFNSRLLTFAKFLEFLKSITVKEGQNVFFILRKYVLVMLTNVIHIEKNLF